MQVRSDPTSLQLGDNVLVEASIDRVALSFRGKLSSIQPKVLWVNTSTGNCPPLVLELKEGHPVRLTTPRDGDSLVGETTFRNCLGSNRRLVAVDRPAELKLVDRRAHLRVPMRLPVGIRLARGSMAGDGGHHAQGTSCDISLNGMKFETNVQMSIGDHVFVSMALDQGRPMHGLAQIVRLEDAITDQELARGSDAIVWHCGRRLIRAAVKWEAISPPDRARLWEFLVRVEGAAAG